MMLTLADDRAADLRKPGLPVGLENDLPHGERKYIVCSINRPLPAPSTGGVTFCGSLRRLDGGFYGDWPIHAALWR